MRRERWMGVLVLAPLLSGACATINTGVDMEARKVGEPRAARVYLRGNTTGITVYREGESVPLQVVMTIDPTLQQAIGNATRQSIAENSGAATYTTTNRLSPTIFLNPKKTHVLKLVRSDGAVVTVERKSHIAKKYFVIDWLLFAPTLGLSIGIDWATGKWKNFNEIDVTAEFARAAARGAPVGQRD